MTMSFLGRLFWLPLLAVASLAHAAEPGGKGILRSVVGGQCFETGSAAVPQVCGTVEVHWKLWALMGEPVGNYGLVWKLSSVHIQDGDGKGSRNYTLGALPPPLAAAAQRSELMLEGLAYVQDSRQGMLAIAFDTGAPARPDGKVSFNVPGSPNWDKFLIKGSSQSQGLAGWCESEGRSYAAPADAKALMRAGVRLGNLQLCPRSSASADGLERAIDKHCSQGAKEPYCAPTKPPSASADLLDRAADKGLGKTAARAPEATPRKGGATAGGAGMTDALDQVQDRGTIARQRETLVAAFKTTAQAACSRELAPLQACVQQACPAVQGPTEASCKEVPNRPARGLGAILTSSSNAPCDAACQRERRAWREQRDREEEEARNAFALRVQAWDERWSALAQQCQATQQARAANAQCNTAAQRQCNPAGTTADSCLQQRMAGAPTEADARAVFDQQQRSRETAGQRPKFLD